jgi:uncharacterized protein YegP (UPF0339 family)
MSALAKEPSLDPESDPEWRMSLVDTPMGAKTGIGSEDRHCDRSEDRHCVDPGGAKTGAKTGIASIQERRRGAKTGIASIQEGAKTGIASMDLRSEDRHCVGRFYRSRSEGAKTGIASVDFIAVAAKERRQALRRSILSQSRQAVARNWQD